jgi:protein-S-isoprenylcysteine O-methyltransferase Ste14
MQAVDWIAATGFFGMIASRIAFALVFQLRRKPAKAPERKRDPKSYWGIGLQAVGFWSLWIVPRRYFSPLVMMSRPAELAMAVLTIAIGVVSVCLCGAAVRTLGKQWTYGARVIEGHELITQGPCALMRNPIYLGMFGMLVATGLAVGRWPVVIGGCVVFLIGTKIRMGSEEKLLREAFGEKFEEYARRVSAFIPGIY